MQLAQLIDKKLGGGVLSAAEITEFVGAMCADRLSDSQIGALARAIVGAGMRRHECVALTAAMRDSGDVLDWSGLDGPLLDKHSTGGVGDTTSLILAPLIAACGAYVPMISGRALGHTGGTLDKLESIPGYNIAPDIELFQRCVAQAGCAVIGQTQRLAPADRKLYAIRDATNTVESVPLITASILSKKLAAGITGLVIDVKTGNGAFMRSIDAARELARSLVAVAATLDLPVTALLTDMSQPLASVAGNALEVRYTIDYLTGAQREPRMQCVVDSLGTELLLLSGLVTSPEAAQIKLGEMLDSGAAATHFARMVHILGGPHDLLERPSKYLLKAGVEHPVMARRDGYVAAIDTRALGRAVAKLGAGSPAGGMSTSVQLGDRVGAQRPLAVLHAGCDVDAEAATPAVVNAYRIVDERPPRRELVIERIS